MPIDENVFNETDLREPDDFALLANVILEEQAYLFGQGLEDLARHPSRFVTEGDFSAVFGDIRTELESFIQSELPGDVSFRSTKTAYDQGAKPIVRSMIPSFLGLGGCGYLLSQYGSTGLFQGLGYSLIVAAAAGLFVVATYRSFELSFENFNNDAMLITLQEGPHSRIYPTISHEYGHVLIDGNEALEQPNPLSPTSIPFLNTHHEGFCRGLEWRALRNLVDQDQASVEYRISTLRELQHVYFDICTQRGEQPHKEIQRASLLRLIEHFRPPDEHSIGNALFQVLECKYGVEIYADIMAGNQKGFGNTN